MMITRDNYEIWFIDFMEGNLSEEQHPMLMAFLAENPDLKDELEGLDTVILSPSDDHYLYKTRLTKHQLDDYESFQKACVAYIEQELNAEETQQLLDYTHSHPEKAKDLELYKKTVLAPETIIYTQKESLKKTRVIVLLQPVFRVAAALVLGFALITSAVHFISTPNLDSKQILSHAGPGTKSQPVEIQQTVVEEQNIAQNTKMEIEASLTPTEDIALNIVKNTSTVNTEEVRSTFNTEKLSPKKPVLKGSVLVFTSPMLDEVEPPAIAPQDPGRFASLFRANRRAEEVVETADRFAKVQLAPSILNLLGEVTSERLTYDTREDGDIAQVNFNSKFLNFTVPIKSNQN